MATKPSRRAGIRTTEFYVVVAGLVMLPLIGVFGVPADAYVGWTILAGLYVAGAKGVKAMQERKVAPVAEPVG